MGMSTGGGGKAPLGEINVTPLVDVMLVLLIIFMVTAPLLTAGVPVDLPDSRAKPLDQEKQPTEISLTGDGKIYIGGMNGVMVVLSFLLAGTIAGPVRRLPDHGRVLPEREPPAPVRR